MLNSRLVYNLDKEWRFHFGEVSDSAGGSHSDSYGKCKAGGVTGPGGLLYDDKDWRLVDLLHDYLTETEFSPENLLSHGYKTRDNAWYRKTFRLDESLKGSHLLLDFEGIAVTAEIYLNGSLMGRSTSAYAPLAIDITDRAWFGDRLNVLAVHVDGLSTEGWWYEGAGIYRHVRLYAKNPLHIANYGLFIKPLSPEPGFVNSSPDANGGDTWTVDTEVEIENSLYECVDTSVKVELFYNDEAIASGTSKLSCPDDNTAKTHVVLKVKSPKIWDIDTPELYYARATLYIGENAVDSCSDYFGFRTIKADVEHGFILNGRPLMLYGTCNHQDHAGVGVAVPDKIQYYRIKRLKELGTNAYRCSHNMPSSVVLDACDRLGMVVMDENRRFETRPEVLEHAQTMIKRDRNHPSVVMYSLFNEEPLQGNETGKRIYNRMKSRLIRLDDSRLITGAISSGYLDPEGCSDAMDITGMNYRIFDWSDFRRVFPNQPLIGSENNSAVTTRACYKSDMSRNVLSGFDEESVPWGQTIRETWDMLKSHPYVGGLFIWTGFDYRGEPTPFEWPSIGSSFGIMDTCGFPKDSFFINKAYFTDEPLAHIIGHWNYSAGDSVRIGAVTNACETELFLNGKSLGRKAPDTSVYKYNNITEWQVDFVPGELKLLAYAHDGSVAAEDVIVTTGTPSKVEITRFTDKLYNDGSDAFILNVHVCDDNKNVVPDASNKIYFEYDPTQFKLLGVGNGDPNCHESDHLPERSLYMGHAQAIFEPIGKAGKAQISVHADRLASDSVVFDINERKSEEYIKESLNNIVDAFYVSRVTEEKPDATIKIPENDMNSFSPVKPGSGYIEGFMSGYVMYRLKFSVPKSGNCLTKYFWFEGIRANLIEFFIDGILIDKLENAEDIKYSLPFSAESGSEHELRIVVQAASNDNSGILNKVTLRNDPGVEINLTV